MNYLLPLISLPYVARTLGPHNFGVIGYAAALMVYFSAIVDFGFNYISTRDVAVSRNSQDRLNQIFSTVLTIKVVLCTAACLILLLLSHFIPEIKAHPFVFMASFAFIPATIFSAEWLFQGLEKMRHIAIASILGKALATLLVFLLVKNPEDYVYVPLLNSLGYWIAAGYSVYVIYRDKLITSLRLPPANDLRAALQEGFNVFLNSFAPNLYNSYGTLLVGSHHGAAPVGILTAAKQLDTAASQFINLISRVFFPYISRKPDNHRYVAFFSIIPSSALSLVLYFFSDEIVCLILGDGFEQASVLLKIIAISPIALSISNVYGLSYLIPRKKTRLLRNITLSTSIIGCVLAYATVPTYGAIAAAGVLSGTRMLKAICCIVAATRRTRD